MNGAQSIDWQRQTVFHRRVQYMDGVLEEVGHWILSLGYRLDTSINKA